MVKFTMLDVGAKSQAIRFLSDSFEGGKSRLSELSLGQRYRFHMYHDAQGVFARCSFISDEYSHLSINSFSYQIRDLDLARGRVEVNWQGVPVANYQKDMETPPPYGHSVLRLVPETRVWKDRTEASPTTLKIGDSIKIDVTSEFSGQPSRCTDVWIVENSGGKSKLKK